MYQILIRLLEVLLIIFQALFKSKSDLFLENLALRQQLSTYQIRKAAPKLTDFDRSFWVALRRVWEKWIDSLIIVKPETVIDWQRRRFKKHWTNISTKNKKPGRKRTKKEIRDLIYRMTEENRWGAPRIYSELLMLGFDDISEATVSRYLRKYRSKHPDKKKQQSWVTFLRNHRDVISAMDFFVVPTIGFKILYVFFIIDHKRRIIRHFNMTNHPSAQWVIQQLRDAFPFDQVPKYLIMDRDKIFSPRVKGFLERQLGINPKVTSYKSPWQNGIAERFVLSARSDLLNHIIIFNEDHLRWLMKEYVEYYNNDRCHLSLGRDSPLGREIQERPSESCKVKSISRLGGLQHRYEWKQVA
ncbi:MAG: transposase [Deltaproteobacteria bacterium]|nr:transposase [Deltaproteobacteria bacterium]MBT6499360.1 transposase [Deltaproteobacteria bacterium]